MKANVYVVSGRGDGTGTSLFYTEKEARDYIDQIIYKLITDDFAPNSIKKDGVDYDDIQAVLKWAEEKDYVGAGCYIHGANWAEYRLETLEIDTDLLQKDAVKEEPLGDDYCIFVAELAEQLDIVNHRKIMGDDQYFLVKAWDVTEAAYLFVQEMNKRYYRYKYRVLLEDVRQAYDRAVEEGNIIDHFANGDRVQEVDDSDISEINDISEELERDQ